MKVSFNDWRRLKEDTRAAERAESSIFPSQSPPERASKDQQWSGRVGGSFRPSPWQQNCYCEGESNWMNHAKSRVESDRVDVVNRSAMPSWDGGRSSARVWFRFRSAELQAVQPRDQQPAWSSRQSGTRGFSWGAEGP